MKQNKNTEISGRHTKYNYYKLKLPFILQRDYKNIERIAQRTGPYATNLLGDLPHLEIIMTTPVILRDLYKGQSGPMKH
jgi:hypothetical protein